MRGGAREGAGRRKVDNPKSERLMISVDLATREKIEKAAAEAGMTVSAFLNQLIQNNLPS